METIALGPDAEHVTVLGFGGMPLSITGRPSEAEAIRVIHAVLDARVTLIDTADVYCLDDDDIGHNERLIAKALATWPGSRNSVVVATKGGLTRPAGRWEQNGRPQHLREACERSLRTLGVDRIDLYQLHAPDPSVPFADSVGALATLREEGKIRWAGLSNVTVAQIDTARAVGPVQTVQNRLNPFFREAVTTGVVKHCSNLGLAFLAYSPVGGGRLNKKLPSHPVLENLAAKHAASAHAMVLAWVRAQGRTVIPIPAARTVDHALDSIRSANITFTDEDLAAIDSAEFSRG